MPWHNHHMEGRTYCSHKTPTVPKDLLTARPWVHQQLPKNPVTHSRWVGKNEGASDSIFTKWLWNIRIWSLKTIPTGCQWPSSFARRKFAVHTFYTKLCETTVSISNLTVNTVFSADINMRKESTYKCGRGKEVCLQSRLFHLGASGSLHQASFKATKLEYLKEKF